MQLSEIHREERVKQERVDTGISEFPKHDRHGDVSNAFKIVYVNPEMSDTFQWIFQEFFAKNSIPTPVAESLF